MNKTATGYAVGPLRKWLSDHGLGSGEHGGARAGGTAVSKELREDLVRAQIEEKKAKADLAMLRLKVSRGEFVSIEQVKADDVARIHATKRGLLALCRRAAPQLVGVRDRREAERVLRTYVNETLDQFSRMSTVENNE